MWRAFLDDLPGELASASDNTGAQHRGPSVAPLAKTGGASFFDNFAGLCWLFHDFGALRLRGDVFFAPSIREESRTKI